MLNATLDWTKRAVWCLGMESLSLHVEHVLSPLNFLSQPIFFCFVFLSLKHTQLELIPTQYSGITPGGA